MKVIIVDDIIAVQERLKQILAGVPKIEIVGTAVSANDAIELIEHSAPHAVILDWSLSGSNGLAVLRHVRTSHPAIKVIVVTNYSDAVTRRMCLEAGADYFLDKSFEYDRIPDILQNLATAGRSSVQLQ